MRWIIGDIHGMLRPLEVLLEAVRKIDSSPRWYFVGDYVNRGPGSKGVIDLLLGLGDAKFVRGNHDDIFDQVLHGKSYAPNATHGDRVGAFKWFMQHGLFETLLSYGVDYDELEDLELRATPERLERVLRVVPAAHREFVRRLEPVVEEEDLFVTHGNWEEDVNGEPGEMRRRLEGDAALRHRLLWGRFQGWLIMMEKGWKRTGYFGHTPVDNYEALLPKDGSLVPIVGPRIVLLDTAVALKTSGRLTAFCHETGEYVQVNHFGVALPAVGRGNR